MSKQDGLGDCYQKNGDIFLTQFRNTDALICHGTATGQGKIKGVAIGHCWIELNNDIVMDYSNGDKVVIRKERYYKIGKIRNVKRYNWDEFSALIQKTGNWSLIRT